MDKGSDIGRIEALLHEMMRLTCESIKGSIMALERHDIDVAMSVNEKSKNIRDLEKISESECMELMKKGLDDESLRRVAYSFKLITHLDRISCHSDNIASIALAVANKPLMHSVLEIDKMSCIALEMLRLCDEGYHGGIAIDMNAIMDENKKLRSLHNEVFLKALSLTLNEPETVTNTVYMILASMALEMIGDHIVEMARRIEFMRTGDISPARTTPNMLETRS